MPRRDHAKATDAELLARFAAGRDQRAFAELVASRLLAVYAQARGGNRTGKKIRCGTTPRTDAFDSQLDPKYSSRFFQSLRENVGRLFRRRCRRQLRPLTIFRCALLTSGCCRGRLIGSGIRCEGESFPQTQEDRRPITSLDWSIRGERNAASRAQLLAGTSTPWCSIC